MSIKEVEGSIAILEAELAKLDAMGPHADELHLQIGHLQEEVMMQLNAWDTACLARRPRRPRVADYIRVLFPGFMESYGDRCCGDDTVCQSGIVTSYGRSIIVLIQSEGKMLEENMQRSFGILHSEGYRRAIRLAKQTEKSHRLIITLVDTAGAYPREGTEGRGQAEIITQCLVVFSEIRTPVSTIILSGGGSGGVLASSVTDHTMTLEHIICSILSPEDSTNVLRKDEFKATEAADAMEFAASDLKRRSIIDTIIAKPRGGTHVCFGYVVEHLREQLEDVLNDLCKKKEKVLLAKRYEKYRVMEANYEEL